jgi:ABC-2 type transport system permease protein
VNPISNARLIAHLAWTEALHALRQPRLMAQLFMLPIIFSTILAIFQTAETAPARVMMTRPNTTLALELEARLKALNLSVTPADSRARFVLARGDRDAWIILPDDFDEQVLNGKPSLELLTPSNNSRSVEVFERVRGAIAQMQAPNVASRAAPGTDAAERTRRLLAERFVNIDIVQAQVQRSSSILEAGGSNQTAPGMTLMFALLFGAQTGLSFQRERTMGTLTRLFSAPTSSFVIVLGKLLGNTLLLLLQLAAMVAFSSLVLGVRWGNVAALVLPCIAFALAAASFGAMAAAVTKTSAQLTALSVLSVNVLSAIGGLWWPLDVTPNWMQNVARFLPTYWGMDALQDVILRGSSIVSVLPNTLILLGFALIFASIGSRAFKYE